MGYSGWLADGVGCPLVKHLFTAPELQPAAPAKKVGDLTPDLP